MHVLERGVMERHKYRDHTQGVLLPLYNRYIILKGREFKAINNKSEFVRFFVLVETPEEALNFAIALTNSYPIYNVSVPQSYRTFVSEIEPTYVEETSGGFRCLSSITSSATAVRTHIILQTI